MALLNVPGCVDVDVDDPVVPVFNAIENDAFDTLRTNLLSAPAAKLFFVFLSAYGLNNVRNVALHRSDTTTDRFG